MTSISDFAAQQPQAVAHLTQALVGSRRAHAYLLVAQHEAQAQALAHAFVCSLFCQARNGRNACGSCTACSQIAHDNHADILRPVQDGQPHVGIGAIRQLCQKLSLTGRAGALKVALVHQADRMGIAAQNALLKTLEEPPPEVCFVLTASRIKPLLPTLRSRLQLLVLHADGEQAASQALQAAGVAAAVSPFAALCHGADVDAAQKMAEQGVASFFERLEAIVLGRDDAMAVARLAQDWGTQRPMAETAILLLEGALRDAMAQRAGVPDARQRLPKLAHILAQRPAAQLVAAADALLTLRQQQAQPINRVFAFEGLFHLLQQSRV